MISNKYAALDAPKYAEPFNDLESSTNRLNAVAPWLILAAAVTLVVGQAVATYFFCTTTRTIETCDPQTHTIKTYEENNWPFSLIMGVPVGIGLAILGGAEVTRQILNYELRQKLTASERDAYIDRLKTSSLKELYNYHRVSGNSHSLMRYVPEIYTAEEAKALNDLFDQYESASVEDRATMEAEWLDKLTGFGIMQLNSNREEIKEARIKEVRKNIMSKAEEIAKRAGVLMDLKLSLEVITPENTEKASAESKMIQMEIGEGD